VLNRDIEGQFGATGDLEKLVSRLRRHQAGGLDDGTPRSVVILGEAAGVPRWESAYNDLAARLALTVGTGESAAEVVRQYLSVKATEGGQLFWRAYSTIMPNEPPVGYEHLANLAAKGCVDLVLTTSWDPLLEIAFDKVLPTTRYRVLTRGELGDREFALALAQRGIPQIVKVNGDLHSQLVTCLGHEHGSFAAVPAVVSALQEIFTSAIVMAAASERTAPNDGMASLLTLAAEADIVYNIATDADSSSCSDWFNQHTRISDKAVTGLDLFMIDLDRRVELAAQRRSDAHSRLLQDEMIRSAELGTASVSAKAVARYVQGFNKQLTNIGIDWVAYIDNPITPGGTEIMKRLVRMPIGDLPQLRVPIVTEGGNRFARRRAVVPWEASIPAGAKIALIDSVAFSGKTLCMATRALQEQFEDIKVFPAVLVASKSLVDRSKNGEKWLERLIFEQITARHELSFPWGVATSTDTVIRRIDYSPRQRSIEIFQRPWGSGEVFATSENCSVRILSIDAAQKLSFQRHLCRDELFVALSDDVGVDLSCDELAPELVDEFDSRIESVAVEEGDYLLVPRGVWHRLRGSRKRVRILEIAFGIYDEDFDIERLLDLYGRADSVE
jgi:mannose-6-phosphate isomerase-like protein (cupin superfamily)